MSDWMPATTGEIIHVDGGVHAVGMALPEAGDAS
jgi:enoyl-[acyl-carrier protein] reductase I